MDFNAILAAEGLTNDSITSEAGLVKLEGNASTKAAGQFVLDGQPLAAKDGFRNVSALWLPKTLTYDQGFERLEEDKAKSLDITATVREMIPSVDSKGEFAFLYRPTETYYKPTKHAMGQIGNWADTGTWFVQNMLEDATDYAGKPKYARDRQDAETLAAVLRNGFRRLDQNKKFFWRARVDGTLRAMLTERFAVVDNRWFLEKLKEFIPGGRLSHWKGDGDTVFGNVLIPDTIREEKDSEYGGMLSIGNSEIGERRISSMPSIFRAICMNGCIWGATKGRGIGRVHRGKINLDSLALDIKKNLNVQIPLLPQGIDRFLRTRQYAWDGCDVKAVIAQVAGEQKMSKTQASVVLKGWNLESKLTPELGHTLFGVINGITRAGQEFSPAEWVKFDEIGGELTEWSEDDFGRVIKRAKSLSVEDVEEAYASVN